jgi:hypothetical protein
MVVRHGSEKLVTQLYFQGSLRGGSATRRQHCPPLVGYFGIMREVELSRMGLVRLLFLMLVSF